MGLQILTFGDPATGKILQMLTDELVYAIGRHADFAAITASNNTAIVLAITAVAPSRGGPLRNHVSFKSKARELWSSHSLDYDRFVEGDAPTRIRTLAAAIRAALDQISAKHFSERDRRALVEAVAAGENLLSSEPERLRPFQRSLRDDSAL